MDLYLFPEAATNKNGYGIGVEFAYNKLKPKQEDLIIWYTDLEAGEINHLRTCDKIIKKNSFYSLRSVKNILQGKDRTEMGNHDLDFLRGMTFENIHCDEVIFYRTLRHLFPSKKITLRLHNCFARIKDRKRLLQMDLDWKYSIKLNAMYKLEREIFQDKNCYKIFISDEDRDYYTSNFGKTSDSETWTYVPNTILIKQNRLHIVNLEKKLIWFGGLESHKMASIIWFIKNVYPQIREAIPEIEFHLWGKNTLKINYPDKKIFGHGFYNGTGLPNPNGLYINPDIIGGGIKLKLLSLFEQGAIFISSPYGFEGYSKDLIDNKYCYVEENDKWADKIIDILNS